MRILRAWLGGRRFGSEERRRDGTERVRRQMAEEERLLRVQAKRSRVEILPFAI
jgi:hypothetical protein